MRCTCGICDNCLMLEYDKKIEKLNDEISLLIDKNILKELTGSPSQKIWANKIRHKMLNTFRNGILIDIIKEQTYSGWFIGHNQKEEFRMMQDLNVTENVNIEKESNEIVYLIKTSVENCYGYYNDIIEKLLPRVSKYKQDEIMFKVKIKLRKNDICIKKTIKSKLFWGYLECDYTEAKNNLIIQSNW